MARPGSSIRRLWAICLLLAGLNHARILLEHGLFWDYHGSGRASAAYWSSLTLIDPLVAIFVLVRPAIGVPATVVLIATNVLHNLAVVARDIPGAAFLRVVASSPAMLCQIGFLIFVLATWRTAWRGVRSRGLVRG